MLRILAIMVGLSMVAFLIGLFVPRRWEQTVMAVSGLAATAAFVFIVTLAATGARVAY